MDFKNNNLSKNERMIRVNYCDGKVKEYALTKYILEVLKISDVESFEIIEVKTIKTSYGEEFTSKSRIATYFIGDKMTLKDAYKAYGTDPAYINVLAHMKSDNVKYVCLTPYKKLVAINKNDICINLHEIDQKVELVKTKATIVSDDELEFSTYSSLVCNCGFDEERYFDRNQTDISFILSIPNLNYFYTNDTDIINYNGEFYFSKPKNEEKYFIGKKMTFEQAALMFGIKPAYINVLAHMRRDGVTTVLLTPHKKLISIPDDAECIEPSTMVFDTEYNGISK